MAEEPSDNVEMEDDAEESPDAAEASQDAPGWSGAAFRAAGFWALLLVALIGGVAIGIFAVPGRLVPGSQDYRDLTASDALIEELSVDAVAREAIIATVTDELTTAAADADLMLEMENITPALFFTVHVLDLENCAEFVGFEAGGVVQSIRVSEIHPCF